MIILWKKMPRAFMLCCSMCFSAAVFLPGLSQAQTITIPNHNPMDDDNNAQGKTITIGGGDATSVISANLSSTFISGSNPTPTPEKLNDLNAAGKVNDPSNILGQHTLALGNQNFGIAIPDPITGAPSTMSVYESANITWDPQAIGDRTVNVYDNVNDRQYINLTIAEVAPSGGTMNVALGSSLTDKASATNHLNLAAKQSTFFKADGSSNAATINWNSNNRVTFFGVSLNPNGTSTVNAVGIPTFGGTFSVTTADGATHNQSVTDEASLRTYNDWLIAELKAGNLKSNEYENLFAKAVTLTDKSLSYQQLATASDEMFEPVGDRIIIHATGEQAVTNINAKLEGDNATTAVQLDNGAKLVIDENGLLGNTNGHVIGMTGTSSTENKGVINVNFLTKADGSRESGGNDNVQGILVNDSTSFTNSGILNIETNGGSGSTVGLVLKNDTVAALGHGYLGLDNNYYSAGNSASGIINVGVSDKSSSGSTVGVLVDTVQSSFINEGEIYLGRTNQNAAGDATSDTSVNQKKFISGIVVQNNGTAVNAGSITLGPKVQNGIGMFANGGDNVQMRNTGTITLLNNNSLSVPNSNYGILVQNTGSSSDISNDGTINLKGVNGIGIKAYSTAAGTPTNVTTTNNSIINVTGNTDPASDPRNYGLWVEGTKGGEATANVAGQINLIGDGAIGVHARGKATINIDSAASTTLQNGKNQIVFFAYGNDAKIDISGAGIKNLNASTDETTIFRMENGADFDDTVATPTFHLKTDGTESKGIVGTGNGTIINLETTHIEVIGTDSVGLWLDGGATGNLKNAATLTTKGTGGIGAIVDSQKYALTGAASSNGQGPNTVLTNQIKITDAAGATNSTGVILRNAGKLINDSAGSIEFANGTNNTGVFLQNGGILENKSVININSGTGILMSGANTEVQVIGQVNVDDGLAGVRLTNNAQLTSTDSSNVITTGGFAHGILMDTGAVALNLTNTAISSLGTGNGIENTAETSNIMILDTNINVADGAGIRTAVAIDPRSTGVVNVSGTGTGFAFVQTDMTSPTTGDLLLGPNYTFNITGAGGTGIKALTTGRVETSGTVNINHTNGGSALLAGTALSTLNKGTLQSVSTASPVVDLSNSTNGTIFENKGQILAVDATNTAIAGSAFADQIFMTAGQVRGVVNSGDGDDYLQFSGGTLDGSITMGNGNNTALIRNVSLGQTSHIIAGSSGTNTLTLDAIVSKGGSFAADDLNKGTNLGTGWSTINLNNNTQFTLTDNLKLASSIVSIDASSTLFAGGGVNPVISGSTPGSVTVHNNGIINLSNGGKTGNVLTIQGNYIGQGGTVIFGTVLADDASQSDRLVIQGDASGQSYVVINNVRGSGAQTSNGIEVIDIGGNSGAQFDLVGRAVAGAYEYSLNRGTDGNWYLQSEVIDDTSAYRPEAGGYLANIAAVNSLFTHQLTDRMQQSVGKDGRSAWVRIVGNHGKFKDSSGRLSTTTNNQVVQVGGDIVAQQLANNGLIKFGALFGYGHTKSKTRGLNANTRATSTGDGYALGLYGTWFQNSADLTGAYVDTWIQYVHFENKVKGSYLQNESYDAKGVIASIEAGYTFKIRPNFFIAPQAQVTWMNVKADDHRESNGTHVRSGGQGNVQTRVGARAFGEFDLSNGGKLRPYAELNWLHNTKSYYVDMDGTRINQQGAKNIGQIKAGINAQFNDQLSIWGDLSHDIGKHSYRNTKVSLGLKYTF